MPKSFICENNKYIYFDDTKSIALPVSLPKLPKTEFSFEGALFSLKPSFHVTLVPIGKMIEKDNISIPGLSELVLKDFCDFVKINPIKLARFRDEFRFVETNGRKTIILMCDVSNLDKFYELINKKYNLKLEVPPTHITIYTLPGDRGIFLIDSEDINLKTRKINILELSECLK